MISGTKEDGKLRNGVIYVLLPRGKRDVIRETLFHSQSRDLIGRWGDADAVPNSCSGWSMEHDGSPHLRIDDVQEQP